MLKTRIFEYLRNEVKTVTIEPIIFLNAFGISIVIGAQVKLERKKESSFCWVIFTGLPKQGP
jgi:hypothetical protein